MQSMYLFHKILILLFGVAISVQAVPPVLNYAGQVAVNGEAFDGNGLFKFALVNTDGTTTYWSNDGTSVDGSEPQASVSVSVNGGLYAVLLGNTAQQGMGAIDPAVFAQNSDAKLRVWFSDGVNGFQQLSPDRPFASVPYAFSAGTAQTAGSAPIANGAVNLDMLSQDVKTQINAPISRSRLSQEVVADINATIGMNRLSTEVTEKLNQEKTTNNYNAPSVGSLLAVPYGSDAPAGYSLYQRGEPKELVWEEKAPVSVARNAYDGVEVLDGNIYFVGGYNGYAKNIAERYDPVLDTWTSLQPLSTPIVYLASSVLNGQLYVIGGKSTNNLNTVKYFNQSTNYWNEAVSLPQNIRASCAITYLDSIYLIGGYTNGQLSKVLEYNLDSNLWTDKANLNEARDLHKLVLFEGRIWAIGGMASGEIAKTVESYDPSSDSWKVESPLQIKRNAPIAWVANGKIFVAGGREDTVFYSSIEVYDPASKSWSNFGNLPETKANADAVVLNDKVYVIGGATALGVYSNKVFAADLNASVEDVYDLYRKDGDAPVGTPVVQSEYADGSVTASKMAEGAVSKSALDATILKYLKPEITSQPQAQKVYAKTNVSYSVTAEGKYLTYQWEKDGVDLAGETNATLKITDANATLHDGNYSVVVSNDFGSVNSGEILVDVNESFLDGLVGWWKFDETSGTVAYDSSGNGNDGNLMNGPTWATGKIGGALNFDGTNDYVKIGASSVFDLQRISISAWVLSENYSNSGFIFEKTTDGSVNSQYALFFENGLRFRNEGGSADDVSFSVLSVGWLFVTSTYDGIRKKLFTNGLERNQIFWTGTIPTSPSGVSAIGGFSQTSHESWSNYIFNGLIDDVRIYDRALSAEEVQALYNLGQ
jgi:N-acetylneuraminic acid mutarotase